VQVGCLICNLRHRQPKGPATDRLNLNHRVTPRDSTHVDLQFPITRLVFQHGLSVSDRHSKIGTAKIFHNSECHTDHAAFAVN
jgi:hypothetical protein